MPGKVNPVLPEVVLQVAAQVIGNDTAITVGGMQGQFELNVRIPLIARNLLQSIHLLVDRVGGVRREVRRGHRGQQGGHASARPSRRSPPPPRSTSTSATTRATAIVKKAAESGRMLREVALEQGVDAELYDAGDRPAPDRRGQRRVSLTRASPKARANRGDGRASGWPRVGEQALLVDAADEADVGDLAVDRAAGERGATREVAQVPDQHRRSSRGIARVGARGASRAGAPGSRSRPGAGAGCRALASAPNSRDDERPCPGRRARSAATLERDDRSRARAARASTCPRTSRRSSSAPTRVDVAVDRAPALSGRCVPQTSTRDQPARVGRCSSRGHVVDVRGLRRRRGRCPRPRWPGSRRRSTGAVAAGGRRVRTRARRGALRGPASSRSSAPGASTGPTPCQTRIPAASRRSSSAGLSGCWARVALAPMRLQLARRSRPCRRAVQRVAAAAARPRAARRRAGRSRRPLSTGAPPRQRELAQADAGAEAASPRTSRCRS